MIVIGRLCASTHDAVINVCVALVSNNTSARWDSTGNYLLSRLVFPGLLQPPNGSISHGCNVSGRDCLLLDETHSALLGHWGLAAELPSLDNASPNGLALHNGNMLYLLLALGLLDCYDWLLGQEDKVSVDSASGTNFLLADCSSDTAADVEGTASETAAEVGADSA
jgi:hypothetical protein